MQLEDYFDFLAPNDIRVKGTRIGVETVLYDFIHRSRTPDEISHTYPSLSLEQIYATITYYFHKQTEMTRYLTAWLEHGERMWAEQQQHPQPVSLRLRKIRAELEAAKQADPNLDVAATLRELSAKYSRRVDKAYVAS